MDPDKVEDAFRSNRRLMGYYECNEGFWYRFKSDNSYETGTEGNPPSTIGAYVAVEDKIVALTYSPLGLSSKSVESYRFLLGPEGIRLINLNTNEALTLRQLVDDKGAEDYSAKLFEQLRGMLLDAERSKSDAASNILQNYEGANYINIYASLSETETPVPPDTPPAPSVDDEYVKRLKSSASNLASALGIQL